MRITGIRLSVIAVSILMLFSLVTASAVLPQSTGSFSESQLLRVSQAEETVAKIRSTYPDAVVTITLNGKTVRLAANQRVRDVVLFAQGSDSLSSYVSTVRLNLRFRAIQLLEYAVDLVRQRFKSMLHIRWSVLCQC